MDNRLDLTYEQHFASGRPDGRYQVVMAAQMAMLREKKGELSLPEAVDEKSFAQW